MTPPLVQTAAPPSSLLVEPEQHTLLPPETAVTLGTTVVIAPHPDDESLGCGGLLALLAAFGNSAHVLVMTDGSRSHPNSPSYPAARLAALREQETLAALEVLGLPASTARFLRYPDCGLPAPAQSLSEKPPRSSAKCSSHGHPTRCWFRGGAIRTAITKRPGVCSVKRARECRLRRAGWSIRSGPGRRPRVRPRRKPMMATPGGSTFLRCSRARSGRLRGIARKWAW